MIYTHVLNRGPTWVAHDRGPKSRGSALTGRGPYTDPHKFYLTLRPGCEFVVKIAGSSRIQYNVTVSLDGYRGGPKELSGSV